MDMTLQEFKFIQQFLAQACGIVLSDAKQYLVKNRLSELLSRHKMHSFADLISALQSGTVAAVKIKAEVIEAMTTNETSWFRDEAQFTELKENLLPQLLTKRGGIKIWSAACSSGQEAYTISLCVEAVGKSGAVKIIGTDISEDILTQARLAVYADSALARGLDGAAKKLYFHPVTGGYKLNPEITGRVRFQQFNLLKPFSVLGRFDIIFCRNVLIYFSEEVKQDILSRMLQVLEPGGILFLSSTEVMPPQVKGFELVRGRYSRYYKKSHAL
ncbi:MAG: hypothetical protein CVV13_13155 [Gammaproteobacteria bacterium HGW-Gammaproteobacteria-3]|nr:MAG: hypothetical protein CVV13_13155 [Gammaproteobacteria bacterium HGW-Gammaproteobacteria-3]